MPIDGDYRPGSRHVFCAIVDQGAVEKHMGSGAVERFLYKVYDKASGRKVGHLWLNKTADAKQLSDVPFGAIVQFEAEVAQYRASKTLYELRNISKVVVVRAPTLERVFEMYADKDHDRLRRGVNHREDHCALCGKKTHDNRFRGYSKFGKAAEFCSTLCRESYVKAQYL
jgi:hypothetical protein